MRAAAILLATAAALAQSRLPDVIAVPAGEFQMGDHHSFVDPAHPSDEVPLHKVSIDALYAGIYPVTNRQYVEFLNGALSAGTIEVRSGMVYGKGGAEPYCETHTLSDYSSIAWDGKAFSVADFRGNHPVVGIRWLGAAAYANWLSAQFGLTPCYDLAIGKCDFAKDGYRLPTEAEWEYLGRGGQYTPYRNFPWGDDADYAKANWPDSKDPYETGTYPWTTPVGFYDGKLKRKSDFNWPGAQETYQTANGVNGFGLYDMSGNVWQWCHDWYGRDYYAASPTKNPTGPEKGDPMPDGLAYRVMRGGNWYNGDAGDPGHGRVSNRDPGYFRGPQDPNHPYYHVGFRVVRPARAITVVSAASYASGPVAPNSIAAAFGTGLSDLVTVKDSAGVSRTAQVLVGTATQVNFMVPAGTASGTATITIGTTTAPFAVEAVAPGLFSARADGTGAAAGVILEVAADGSQKTRLIADGAADLSAAAVYLLLFGTGMRGFSQTASVTVGGVTVPLAGPVAQPEYAGLDQVNVGPLPGSLAGRGNVPVILTVDGSTANAVTVSIR